MMITVPGPKDVKISMVMVPKEALGKMGGWEGTRQHKSKHTGEQ